MLRYNGNDIRLKILLFEDKMPRTSYLKIKYHKK